MSASATAAPATAPVLGASSHNIAIDVEGLRNRRGNLLVCITANPAAFPDCRRDPAATRARIGVDTLTAGQPLRLDVRGGGEYAIAIIHDENGNDRLDTLFAMPREGFGFSRNPAIGFGPPRFSAAAFPVDAASTAQMVRIRYML